MRKGLVICLLIIIFCVSVGIASAGVPTIHANDIFSIEPGDEFEVEVFIECHAVEANYTVNVTLHPRFQFVEEESDMIISGTNASITYLGYDTDELRFEFPMMALNDTPEGDYNIPYRVYWNGSETSFVFTLVESDTVQVSVGEGGDSACSTTDSLILPIFGISIAFGIFKKQKR
jgi:hypothetical protein